MTWRLILGLSLLLFQVGAIVYARFVPARYFCWAPYDMQTEYQVSVRVNGRPLSAREIRERYRRPARGVDNRSVQHVIDIFEQTEQRYHGRDPAEIVMRYRVNGHREGEWRWPKP
jgi:hypothetical protein